jgi:hypothetical protein
MSNNRTIRLLLTLFLLSSASLPVLAGFSPHEVLLVVNSQSPVSQAIGRYYQTVRGVPDVNVCTLTNCPNAENIDPSGWYDNIRTPIWNYLNDPSHPWLKDQVFFDASALGFLGRSRSLDKDVDTIEAAF